MLAEPRGYYYCDVCGHYGQWNEPSKEWAWFGSYIDDEEGTAAHLCSDQCRDELDHRIATGAVRMPVWAQSGVGYRSMKEPGKGYGQFS